MNQKTLQAEIDRIIAEHKAHYDDRGFDWLDTRKTDENLNFLPGESPGPVLRAVGRSTDEWQLRSVCQDHWHQHHMNEHGITYEQSISEDVERLLDDEFPVKRDDDAAVNRWCEWKFSILGSLESRMTNPEDSSE